MDGCDIRVNSRVVKVDDNFEAGVQLKDGSWVRGDLVIAADGIKSNIRRQIAAHHKHIDRATPTGDAAYRIVIPRERMQRDPETLDMISQNAAIRWMGKLFSTVNIFSFIRLIGNNRTSWTYRRLSNQEQQCIQHGLGTSSTTHRRPRGC